MSPGIAVTEELFELDRDRFTTSGGSAPLDMMLQLVNQRHGKKLAVSISEQFVCDRMRGAYDKQRIPLKLLLGADQPKLTEAVELMESNLEELINLDDLANLVGVSRRQLERLFKKYLSCVPRRYYLDLRLRKRVSYCYKPRVLISKWEKVLELLALQLAFFPWRQTKHLSIRLAEMRC